MCLVSICMSLNRKLQQYFEVIPKALNLLTFKYALLRKKNINTWLSLELILALFKQSQQ